MEETSNPFPAEEDLNEASSEDSTKSKLNENETKTPPEVNTDEPVEENKEAMLAELFMKLPDRDRRAIYDLAVSMIFNKNKPDSVVYQILRKTGSKLIQNKLV